LTAFVHISLKLFHDVDRIFRAPNTKWNDGVHLGKRQSTGDQETGTAHVATFGGLTMPVAETCESEKF